MRRPVHRPQRCRKARWHRGGTNVRPLLPRGCSLRSGVPCGNTAPDRYMYMALNPGCSPPSVAIDLHDRASTIIAPDLLPLDLVFHLGTTPVNVDVEDEAPVPDASRATPAGIRCRRSAPARVHSFEAAPPPLASAKEGCDARRRPRGIIAARTQFRRPPARPDFTPVPLLERALRRRPAGDPSPRRLSVSWRAELSLRSCRSAETRLRFGSSSAPHLGGSAPSLVL
jgi:hypothetical protein